MDILKKHEVFEMEVLETMNSTKALEPLVFGGGSMLRLCHDLTRYSVDLDFWFIKKISQDAYFQAIQTTFGKAYEMTDAQMKYYTISLELRSAAYPKRLKIEIRRKVETCDYQEKIAFSKFTTKQVILKTHTLEQTMKNKVAAFLDRGEIRDCFDIEFMLRRGVDLPLKGRGQCAVFQKKLAGLKDVDFRVKLGSILETKNRDYYLKHRFSYLEERVNSILSMPNG